MGQLTLTMVDPLLEQTFKVLETKPGDLFVFADRPEQPLLRMRDGLFFNLTNFELRNIYDSGEHQRIIRIKGDLLWEIDHEV